MASGQPSVPAITQHIQTILVSIITGSIVFAATYFFNDKAEKAVFTQQLSTLTQQVIELRADIKAMQGNYVTKDGRTPLVCVLGYYGVQHRYGAPDG